MNDFIWRYATEQAIWIPDFHELVFVKYPWQVWKDTKIVLQESVTHSDILVAQIILLLF